ncbi:uncharacterized protein isoform X2 [Choristoneura fumiferana]|uniref:uncharacterized protein isoform X2 n=1 Tax=Choristoneura fumiferana TaxID=7141 RepID=UPI003D159096
MADKKKTAAPSGDAGPDDKKKKDAGGQKGKGKKGEDVAEEELPKTDSQILAEEAEYRAMLRRTRFKRQWPEVTKVKIRTRPWHPPPPPQRIPQPMVELPELTTRRWVPPYRRRRRPRPRRMRVPPEEVTREMYECNRLRRIWHNFMKVDKNKMMLQGSIACNSKRYSSTHCGSQTGCIAVACRVLLQEKASSELTRRDVDELIETGDRFYHQCMVALKCYKGKPQLELKQLLTSLFFHEAKYTVKMVETDKGLLAKHPDNIQAGPDLMALMEKRVGSTYMMILTVGTKHFLVWGHPPPPEAGSQCKTVCYIFDPHMLDDRGTPHKLYGAGAFLRYAGVTSFVLDFLANYGDLDSARKGAPKPPIALTEIEVVQREPLLREPKYELDLKALRIHCRSEWESIHMNALIDKKRQEGEYPLCSLSAVSLATSKATPRKKVREFYQKTPKEPPPVLPMAPERAPPGPTNEQLMSLRGEDFFLYCPKSDGHTYGRDDMIPQPKSETILHSPVDVATKNFHSQFQQLDPKRWILRGTRHMASYRYQTFKSYTAIPCCVAALAMLRRLRARGWNEDTLDETLDLGYNLYRESLLERGGPIRRLVLGELKDNFRIRDSEYYHKEKGIAVWGKCISSNPKVFDLSRGIERFFKDSDAGLLQIPGEYETAIWNEGGMYYLYHPWPADRRGLRVGLRDGGKACLLQFSSLGRLVDHFLESTGDLKRKPFSISDVNVKQRAELPEPENELKPVAPGRWVVRGGFHEADARFPEEHRGKQATPASIAAIAMAHVVPPTSWTRREVDESVVQGDLLYQSTVEHLERMGISLDAPKTEEEGEEEEEKPSGTLAAIDVMNRFKLSDYDCIETEVLDNAYSGSLSPDSTPGVMSLKQSLRQLFKEHKHAVVTARGGSTAVWKDDKFMYFFDPHGCDENGYPSSDPRAAACLVRVKGSTDALAAAIESNLSPGPDDSFNISPVLVTATKLNPDIGAPETNLESTDFAWIRKGTAAIMMGPRGENSAIGKAAERAGIGEEDKAGRTLALPAAAAFCAAADAVPPPLMHQDHMFNFLEAGADYYNQLVKKTGNKDMVPEDLTEKFEMGANTFSIELEEPIRLPLRLPDAPVGEGEGEGGEKEALGEGEEEPEKIKEIKDLLFKMWYDQTKPTTVSLLVGDYHQLGVWMACGGKVVAFDPAPTLARGLLTSHRIEKGDELRLQRIKDEMAGEGGGEPGGDEEEAGAEGEEKPEPEPEPVPRESTPVLMVFASPGEFIDKLTLQGGLDKKQCLAPYKLYPVKVGNDLTAVLKEKRSPPKGGEGDEPAAGEEEEEVLVEALDDAAVGKYMTRLGRATASVRGRLAQNENFFLETARDNQDAAMSVVAIVVDHIEPHVYWKPALIDAILKYGDRCTRWRCRPPPTRRGCARTSAPRSSISPASM